MRRLSTYPSDEVEAIRGLNLEDFFGLRFVHLQSGILASKKQARYSLSLAVSIVVNGRPPPDEDVGVRKRNINGLSQALAETAVTTIKAQNYQWKVAGMAFGSLHALSQENYDDHFEAQDTLAEGIKALVAHVDGRLAALLNLSKVKECGGPIPATEVLRKLASDQSTITATLSDLDRAAERHDDLLSQDLAIQRKQNHEKFAWMLDAHLSS
ncbi:MAG: DNA starvation/stationary phase protection protein [Pseudomonadota bacterium]